MTHHDNNSRCAVAYWLIQRNNTYNVDTEFDYCFPELNVQKMSAFCFWINFDEMRTTGAIRQFPISKFEAPCTIYLPYFPTCFNRLLLYEFIINLCYQETLMNMRKTFRNNYLSNWFRIWTRIRGHWRTLTRESGKFPYFFQLAKKREEKRVYSNFIRVTALILIEQKWCISVTARPNTKTIILNRMIGLWTVHLMSKRKMIR